MAHWLFRTRSPYRALLASSLVLGLGCGGSSTAATTAATTPEAPPEVAIDEDSADDPAPTRETARILTLNSGARAYLVPAAAAEPYLFGYDHDGIYWTPSVAEAAALEAALPCYLATRRGHLRELSRPLSEYQRHFVGMERGGRRVLFMAAFCEHFGDDWTQPIQVDDGGDCFFEVWYDPDSATVTAHMVHGDA